MPDGAFQRFRALREALAEARNEFVVRFRIAAVAVARFRGGWRESAVERLYRAAANFVLNVEYVFERKVMFLGIGDLFRCPIVQLQRDTPARSQFLNVPSQDVADPQIVTRLGEITARRVFQNRRCGRHSHILQVREHGN
jgi:hypothetical protein